MSNEQTVEQADVKRFPGQRLQSARIAKGITVEEISTSLHLPTAYIHSLENGDIDKLPSVVFARGYVRSYAKLVDLSADEFIAYLDELYDDSAQRGRSIKSVTKVRQQIKASHPFIRILSWLLLGLVIGASIWWWRTQNTSISTVSITSAVEDAIIVDSSDGQTLKIPALEDSLPADSQPLVTETEVTDEPETAPESLTEEQLQKMRDQIETSNSEVAAIVVEPQPAVVEDAPVQPVEPQAPVTNEPVLSTIQIQFKSDCWVTIKDSSGKTLISKKGSKTSPVDISASGPFSIVLGASASVSSFTYNGSDINFAQYSKNNVARFSLPLQ